MKRTELVAVTGHLAASATRGNGRMPVVLARLSVASADELAWAWDSMRRTLEDTRLDWAEPAHQELQAVLTGLFSTAGGVAGAIRPHGERHAAGAAAVKRSLHEAASLHLEAARAQFELYGAARRRAEIVQVLTELGEGTTAAPPSTAAPAKARPALPFNCPYFVYEACACCRGSQDQAELLAAVRSRFGWAPPRCGELDGL